MILCARYGRISESSLMASRNAKRWPAEMCGICGMLYCGEERRVQRETLAQMNAHIVHRGPDDDGFFVEGNVGLAMRRLSIIDIRTGQQPISNEDRSEERRVGKECRTR